MKAFFDKLGKNETYVKIFKTPFTYLTGAILLSIFQVVSLGATGDPWGVSGTFANWGAWLYRLVGGNVDRWYYFSSAGAQAVLDRGFLNDPGTMRNLGIIFGALAAVLLASQFKIKKIKSKKQVVAAVVGGFLMGSVPALPTDATSALCTAPLRRFPFPAGRLRSSSLLGRFLAASCCANSLCRRLHNE